jgi:hypothetical protein
MSTYDAVFVGKITLPEVSTGPVPPQPGGPVATPPIYIPVVPPGAPEHPIYIPVFPSHPIVLPPDNVGDPPVVWPPLPPLSIWPSPGHPAHPIAPGGPPPGIWPGPNPPYVDIGFPGPQPMPTPPIYIPIVPPPEAGAPPEVTHPIYLPVYPAHPIYLPGHPEHPIVIPPELPPAFVSPPSGARGYWGYSPYYQSPVFVPYTGSAPGTPETPPVAGRR